MATARMKGETDMAKWNFPVFGHGADYNPDQWRHIPGTLDEDIRLMKLSHCNIMSVGIFSWAALEPEEGQYDFGWLKEVLDKLHANGVSVLLATPSGARPAWMSQKYPEVLRVRPDGGRNLHGERHNHCYTSPVYRDFVKKMNTALAEAFGHHPAVVGWHVSNEYGGECHCELCQAEFRKFLQNKYGTLETLNQAWWTGFWAKTYTDWSQLHSPTPIGETCIHGLTLDWKRFVTHQTVDFMRAEVAPLKEITPELPVTANMMHTYDGLDYYRFRDVIDFASFDCYPRWGVEADDVLEAERAAFNYDIMRSLKDGPWVLMESTPSQVNWQNICMLKRPGVHLQASMQAVAHGADSIQYFQWRKSRGSTEKFHGAVVDHVGNEHTRTFREVTEVGEWLQKLQPVLGADVPKQVALIYDMDNLWAQENAQGPRKDKRYAEVVVEHYGALKRNGLTVDVIDETMDFAPYRMIVAPQMYLVKPGVAERLKEFVRAGGVLVSTYYTGYVDENDLVKLGGWPGDMMDLFGIWAEEIEALPEGRGNAIIAGEKRYECGFMCEIVHAKGAQVVGTYESDFYGGMPALTKNAYGSGEAWHIASRVGVEALTELYGGIAREKGIAPVLENLPYGVHADVRENENGRFLFVQNYAAAPKTVCLPKAVNVITGEAVGGETEIPVHGILIAKI